MTIDGRARAADSRTISLLDMASDKRCHRLVRHARFGHRLSSGRRSPVTSLTQPDEGGIDVSGCFPLLIPGTARAR